MADLSNTLASLEKTWSPMYPDQLYQFEFLDEQIRGFYKREQMIMTLIQFFSAIAILIGCMGLYGLASFMAIQKTKEIGIRKVLGASVSGIAALLSKDFLQLVVIAFLIASPVAWYLMDKWLQDFAYRIDLAWWMFALAGLGAVVIALLTVSSQAIKAAIANPVDSLKSE